MFRVIAWAVLALYLLIVGVWPSAAAPVSIAFTGLGVVLAAIPLPAVLAIVAVIAWEMRHRSAPAKTVAA
ncbi:hypothetical protein [Streptomyces sp. NBC_01614]|uniref:hypothetical protein n=1 Tax=Streptomyces sp. NBC_01614 TaxID=2975897 RepID=UPI00386EF4E3